MRIRKLLPLVALTLVPVLAGCGLKPASAFIPAVSAGSIKPVPALKGVTIRVTSKDFTEQLILGKMTVQALKVMGANVQDRTNVQGSTAARNSMLHGQNDVQWEYTGTGWITYLGHDKPVPDPQKQYQVVRDEDLKKNGIVWLKPSTFNNTYAIAVTQKTEKKYGLKNLSDIAKVPTAQRTFCVETEFASRPDGMPGMLKAYGLNVPQSQWKRMGTGVVYDTTAKGGCTFGEVFDTDGRIKALNLTTLKDDKKFFPIYNPSVTFRKQVYDKAPQAFDAAFAKIANALNTNIMRELNAKVDVEGQDPAIVAKDWMMKEGFVK
ncbi:MAG TPA: glycine betaine ABC transporter substrate-binding protein [Streptosporangiaceae bacterium]